MRLLLLLGLVAACAKKDTRSTLDQVLERGVLIIGTEPEFPPFETKDENGEFVGFDMDMARELAKDLGISDTGYRLVLNCNRDGGQAVFHLHLHLLGGRPLSWPPG